AVVVDDDERVAVARGERAERDVERGAAEGDRAHDVELIVLGADGDAIDLHAEARRGAEGRAPRVEGAGAGAGGQCAAAVDQDGAGNRPGAPQRAAAIDGRVRRRGAGDQQRAGVDGG